MVLDFFFKTDGPLLRIPSAQVKDRGIYICKASNEGGTAQASSILDIERMYIMKMYYNLNMFDY